MVNGWGKEVKGAPAMVSYIVGAQRTHESLVDGLIAMCAIRTVELND